MSRFAASFVLAVLTLPVGASADADSRAQDNSKENRPAEVALAELPALDSIAAQLDLRVAPPRNAYAITGDFLPPFLQAVLLAWKREFPQTPLPPNSIIFVIRPADFYSDLDSNQRHWLASCEMLGIRNFPLIINPLTPGDDWYLRAQKEWREGNQDGDLHSAHRRSTMRSSIHSRLATSGRPTRPRSTSSKPSANKANFVVPTPVHATSCCAHAMPIFVATPINTFRSVSASSNRMSLSWSVPVMHRLYPELGNAASSEPCAKLSLIQVCCPHHVSVWPIRIRPAFP